MFTLLCSQICPSTYLGFFFKPSSATELYTQRAPLLLSKIKKHHPKGCAMGSAVSKYHSQHLQTIVGCSILRWRKNEMVAEHPSAKSKVEGLLGLVYNAKNWKTSNINSFWPQTSAHRRKMLRNQLFPVFLCCWSNLAAGDVFKPSASSQSNFWNSVLLQRIISARIFQKRNKSENMKRHKGQ